MTIFTSRLPLCLVKYLATSEPVGSEVMVDLARPRPQLREFRLNIRDNERSLDARLILRIWNISVQCSIAFPIAAKQPRN
jgi:hypothetical protein